jgi:hypothetical protein
VKIKVLQAFCGSGFDFRYGQIIECPKKVGDRLIEHGVGEAADAAAVVEGTFDDTTPKEILEARERESRAPKKVPEKAAMSSGAKATTTGEPSSTCKGETKQGNPCARVPLPGSEFCAAHQPKA